MPYASLHPSEVFTDIFEAGSSWFISAGYDLLDNKNHILFRSWFYNKVALEVVYSRLPSPLSYKNNPFVQQITNSNTS